MVIMYKNSNGEERRTLMSQQLNIPEFISWQLAFLHEDNLRQPPQLKHCLIISRIGEASNYSGRGKKGDLIFLNLDHVQ